MVDAPTHTTESVLATITAFATFEEGWDAARAAPISPTAIDLACSIVKASVIPPDAVPCSDGGVQLEWHVNGVDLEIWIHHDGVLSYIMEQERAHLTTVRMLLEHF